MNYKSEEFALKQAIPMDVWKTIKKYDGMIAGGAIISVLSRNTINDIDVYLRNREDALQLGLDLNDSDHACMACTTRSMIFCRKNEIPINVIFMNGFAGLYDVFDWFDFECCKGGYDLRLEIFVFADRFGIDNWQKRLTYNKSKYPVGALFRMHKYTKRGYKISKGSMLQLFNDLKKVTIESREELADQIGALYGLDIDKMWPADKPFDFDEFIELVANGDIHFKDANPKFHEPNQWIKKLLDPAKLKFKTIPHWSDKVFGIFAEYDGKPLKDNYLLDDLVTDENSESIAFPFSVYKKVKNTKHPEQFRSAYRPDFIYRLGEIVDGGSVGLWCHTNKVSARYHDESAIRLEVQCADDFEVDRSSGIPTGLRVRRARFVEVL